MNVEDSASRVKQEKTKKLLFESLKKRTSYYLNKPVLEDTDLYYYVKDFFREYLEASHELSFDEIIVKIDKIYMPSEIKKGLVNYINNIRSIEYKDDSFSEDKIKHFIKEFYDLSNSLREEEKKENSFFSKFLKSLGLKKKDKSDSVKKLNNNLSIDQDDVQEIVDKHVNDDATKNINVDSYNKTDVNPVESEFKKADDFVQEDLKEEPKRKYDEEINEGIEEESQKDENEPKVEEDFQGVEESENVEDDVSDYLKNVPEGDDFTEDISFESGNKKNDRWSNKEEKKDTSNDAWVSDVNPEDKQDFDDKIIKKNSFNDDPLSVDSSSNKNFDQSNQDKQKTKKKTATKKKTTKKAVKKKETKTPTNKKTATKKKTTKKKSEKTKKQPAKTNSTKKTTKKTTKKVNDGVKKNKSKNVFDLLKESKKIKDTNKLKKLYKEIHDLYETSNDDDQKKIYPELLGLYKKISNKK